MNKDEYWFWLCNIKNIYNEQIEKLLKVFPNPEEVYKGKPYEYEYAKLTKSEINAIEKSKNDLLILKQKEKLEKDGIKFINPDSKDYPEKFRFIKNAPYSLYVKGNLPDPNLFSVGMVGARACSEYGRSQTIRFAKALALKNIQIISGLALGIDSISANAALSVGGKTFAVLGSGIDVIYPKENIELYYEIIMNDGGIITEYPLGTPPIPWQFPSRNRLISGLSDKILIMEARKRSGTLVTASYALEQGKDIYCLPGKITDSLSDGCNKLIADGAGILLNPEYLLSDLDEITTNKNDALIDNNEHLCPIDSESDTYSVYSLLGNEPICAEDIMQKTSLNPETISIILMDLEISGLIREVSKNYYVKILY